MGSNSKQCVRSRNITLVDCADEGPDGVDYGAFIGEKLTMRTSTKREAQNNLPGPRALPPTPSGPIRDEASAPDGPGPATSGN
jgi:hypothetical protein